MVTMQATCSQCLPIIAMTATTTIYKVIFIHKKILNLWKIAKLNITNLLHIVFLAYVTYRTLAITVLCDVAGVRSGVSARFDIAVFQKCHGVCALVFTNHNHFHTCGQLNIPCATNE